MANVNRWESVGWVFWSVCFFLSLPGCIYLLRNLSYSNVSVFGYVVFGFMLAGGVASVITWVMNSVLGVYSKLILKQEKKQEKRNSSKRQKKKNKKNRAK